MTGWFLVKSLSLSTSYQNDAVLCLINILWNGLTKLRRWPPWCTQSPSPDYKWTQHWYTAMGPKDSCFRIWLALMLMRALPLFLTPKVSRWSSPSSSFGFWHPCPDGGVVSPLSIFFFFFFSHAKYTNGVLPLGVDSAYGHHEYLPDLIITDTHTTKERKHGMWTAGLPPSLHLKLF